MKWLRLYSEARTDAKLKTLTREQRWVWVCLLCFASEQPERGTISGFSDKLLAAEVADGDIPLLRSTLTELQDLRIINENEGTIVLENFKKRQYDKPSDQPEKVKQRVDKLRAKRQSEAQGICSNADVTRRNATDTDTDTDTENKRRVPASAAPRRSSKNNSLSFADDSPEMRLAKRLDYKMRESNPTVKPATKAQLQNWANDARLMLERDERPYDDIKTLIDFTFAHEFWFKNIQSMTTFRKQYSRLWAETHPTKAGPAHAPPKPWIPPKLTWDEMTPREREHYGSREAYEGVA